MLKISNVLPAVMSWPILFRLSLTVSRKSPLPEPIAGVSVRRPFQFVPAPLKVMGTLEPAGGLNISAGGVPALAGSVSVRFTATSVLLVVWTGLCGALVIAPDGGLTSTTKAGPAGGPLNALPAMSCAETFNWAGPEDVNGVTLSVPS